jgi:hypothetical protein
MGGRTYQLQRSVDLANPNGWENLGQPIEGTGQEEFITDELVPLASPHVFYRFIIRE